MLLLEWHLPLKTARASRRKELLDLHVADRQYERASINNTRANTLATDELLDGMRALGRAKQLADGRSTRNTKHTRNIDTCRLVLTLQWPLKYTQKQQKIHQIQTGRRQVRCGRTAACREPKGKERWREMTRNRQEPQREVRDKRARR